MQKSRFHYTIFVAACLAIGSCIHELPVPTDTSTGPGTGTPSGTCNPDTVYFANTILPIVNNDCGKVGCHGSSGPAAFGLTSYASIASVLGSVGGLNGALSDMADQKSENPSLNYTPPTSDQMTALQKWISQGARNNSCIGACDTTQFTYSGAIAPLLSLHCVGCHTGSSASAGVDLSSYSSVQAEINNNPGRLLGSIQWTPPYTGTKQMPLNQSKLPDCNIAQVKKWIEAGALNN